MTEVTKGVCRKYKDAVMWIADDLYLPDIDWSTYAITGRQS